MKRRWPWIIAVLFLAITLAIRLDPTGFALGTLRGEPTFESRPTTAWLIRLGDSNPATQEAARRALRTGGVAAVPVLADMLRPRSADDWSSVERRIVAAETLRDIGPAAAAAAPALIAALTDNDAHMRAVAAEALGVIGPVSQAALPALVARLELGDGVPVLRAIAKFGEQGRSAEGLLIARLKDPDTAVRWNAARTLGKIHAQESGMSALVVALKDPEGEVREHAAEALGDIGPPAVGTVPALIAATADEYWKVRRDSARSLGQIGPGAKAAGDTLRKLLNDPEAGVRDAAKTALKGIGDPVTPSK